jgi:hypothetical protein
MRLSFDHLEQHAESGLFRKKPAGYWLICTPEFTDVELAIIRSHVSFGASIGLFYLGHPQAGQMSRVTKTRKSAYAEMRERQVAEYSGHPLPPTRYRSDAMGRTYDENNDVLPLSLDVILSGKPICLFRSTPAAIKDAETLMTNVFSDLKARIEANASAPVKRTIDL